MILQFNLLPNKYIKTSKFCEINFAFNIQIFT